MSFYFSDFSCATTWPRLSVRSCCSEASWRSDVGYGRSSDARRPASGKTKPVSRNAFSCNPPSPTAVAWPSHRLPIPGHRQRPNKIDGCGRVPATATTPKPSEMGSCEPLRSAPERKEVTRIPPNHTQARARNEHELRRYHNQPHRVLVFSVAGYL